jgi:hypothetical protein
MSGQPAVSSPSAPRVLVVDDGKRLDVFDVVGLADGIARVRSPFLFEIGEELKVRIERDGKVTEATARVRAHLTVGDDKVTELELSEETSPTKIVSG